MFNDSTSRLISLAGLLFLASPVGAIMQWNEGKDQIFVRASASWIYDSNIYTSSSGEADSIIRGSIGAEYRRQAGLIGVNADVGFTISEFGENADESFANPNVRFEFNKDTGRTTGTLGFNFNRSSRADPAVNSRTDSWNYGAELRVKYPVSERHSFSGGLDYAAQDYNNNAALVDIETTSLAADWFYVFRPERDLFGGYRLRISETSIGSRWADHSISGGIAGKLIRGLNGTARVGYQVREELASPNDAFSGGGGSGFNASVTSTWNFSRTVALSGRLSRDFNVTSTNISTDVTSGALDLQWAKTAKLVLGAGTGMGHTKFLGINGADREDTYFTYYGRIAYTFSEKLKIAATYSYFRNWSTLSFSDFERDSITFDASSRF